MKRTLIALTCLTVCGLLAALPATAATSSQFANGWTVGNVANWTPFPPSGAPLGASDGSCTNSGGTPQFAEFTFPAFSIPGGDTITGIEVVFDYLSISSSNRAQLKLSGGNNGNERTIAQQGGSSSCGSAVPVTAGGAADLWGSTLTVADFNAGNVSVRFLHDATTVLIDSVELRVTHGGAPDLLPDAVDDPATVGEDSGVNPIAVLGNDDLGDTPTTIVSVTDPPNGTAAINGTSVDYTPDGNYNGADSFDYTIRDNDGDEDTATVNVTVTAVNDAPSFSLSGDVTVDEDFATTESVTVTPDPVPADETGQAVTYSLAPTSVAFANVSISSSTGEVTITAVANASGSQLFTVTADDGQAANNTATDTFTLTVNAVNDPPTLDDPTDPAAILEDAAAQNVALSGIAASAAGDESQTLTVTATSDNTALIPNPTVNYTSPDGTGSLDYTPVANAFGSAVITVTVTDDDSVDGTALSVAQTFTVEVTAVNDPPTLGAIADPAAIDEDAASQNVALSGIAASAAGDESQTLTVTASSDNTALIPDPTVNYSSPAATGSLDYTPVAEAYGSAVITVTVSDDTSIDGTALSVVQTFTVTVDPVNDVPSFTKGADQEVDEDALAQTVSGWATALSAGAGDEADQSVSFNVANDNNGLFAAQPAISPAGELTYTPAANQFGSATVTVSLSDNCDDASPPASCGTTGQLTSADQTFTITVNPINDQPTFDPVSDPPAIQEDAGPQTVAGFATGISAGAANESDQTLTFNIVGNSNPGRFLSGPAIDAVSGDLTYEIKPDRSGVTTIEITLSDDCGGATPPPSCGTSGVDTSASQTFDITVNDVNDAPTFDFVDRLGAPDVTQESGTGQQSVPWATNVSPGPANESTQTVAFVVTNVGNAALFDTGGLPAVSPAGDLLYTPADFAKGTTSISVKLTDNGGTANGGVDESAEVTFSLTLVDQTAPIADPQSVFTDGINPLTIVLTGSDPNGELPLDFFVIPPVTDPDSGGVVSTSGPISGSVAPLNPQTLPGGVSADVVYTPEGPFITETVIVASDSFVLEKFADVLSGDVVVNETGGTATIERSTTTPAGFAVKSDQLDVDGTATVGGDAFCNSGDYFSQCALLALPAFDPQTDPLPPFLLGSVDDNNDVTVAFKGSQTISPGIYGDIFIDREGELIFNPGKYSMRSLTADNKSDLVFGGATEIKIADQLELGPNVDVGASGQASDIIFYVAGPNAGGDPAATIGFNNANFFANVYAPNGTISIGSDSAVTGAFFGKDVVVGSKATVTLDSAFSEPPDEFAFEVVDQAGLGSNQAVVTINADGSCRDDNGDTAAIAAFAGEAETDGASSIQIVLAGCESNDSDVTFALVQDGAKGDVTGLPSGPVGSPYTQVVTYAPDNVGLNERDNFVFSISNGVSTVQATVLVNEPPCDVVSPQPVFGETDKGLPLTLTLTACDPEDLPLTFTTGPVTGCSNPGPCSVGAVNPITDNRPGFSSAEVIFTHAELTPTIALFDFTADNGTTSADATVTVEVNAINLKPVANNDSLNVEFGGVKAGNVLANDTDPNGDALTASVTVSPASGTLTFDNATGNFTYTHDGVSTDTDDSFKYTASDGALTSDEAMVSIAIAAAPVSVTVNLAGAGASDSRVFSNPAGIDCGSGCTSESKPFTTAQVVRLFAEAATGYLFDGWSGDCDFNGNVVLLGAAPRSCTASFIDDPGTQVEIVNITIEKAGDGDGTVTSDPAGVDCGLLDCFTAQTFAVSRVVPQGSQMDKRVLLLPQADGNSQFAGFIGGPDCPSTSFDCDCQDGELDGDLPGSCTAIFNENDVTLTITIIGSGSVKGNGIFCAGNPCSANYPLGTVVDLSGASDASRDPANVTWGNVNCIEDPTFRQKASVTLGASKSCTVTFN